MEKEKVLDKVKKLLALGRDGGATEAEQSEALRMAAMLLAKHGLSESEISMAEYTVHTKNVVVGLGKWKGVLAMAAANLYGAYVTQDKRSASMMFYGPVEIAEAAAMTYEHLIEQVMHARDVAVQGDASISGQTWGNNFKNAAASRIYARVSDIIKGCNVEGSGTSLAVHTQHLQEKTKEILGWQNHKPGKHNWVNHSLDAHAAGIRAGDLAQLNKTVQGQQTSGILLLSE